MSLTVLTRPVANWQLLGSYLASTWPACVVESFDSKDSVVYDCIRLYEEGP